MIFWWALLIVLILLLWVFSTTLQSYYKDYQKLKKQEPLRFMGVDMTPRLIGDLYQRMTTCIVICLLLFLGIAFVLDKVLW